MNRAKKFLLDVLVIIHTIWLFQEATDSRAALSTVNMLIEAKIDLVQNTINKNDIVCSTQ